MAKRPASKEQVKLRILSEIDLSISEVDKRTRMDHHKRILFWSRVKFYLPIVQEIFIFLLELIVVLPLIVWAFYVIFKNDEHVPADKERAFSFLLGILGGGVGARAISQRSRKGRKKPPDD